MRSKKACIVAAGEFEDRNCLLKVRDRNYVPAVRIIRDIIDGVEVAYLHDLDTDWSEGLNEYGIGVVSSALMVIEDESVKKERTRAPDGTKIRKILSKKTLGGAVNEAVHNGVTGHTFIASPSEIATIEMDGGRPEIRVLDTADNKVAVRTNHGEDIDEAGYTGGPDFKSSKSRKHQAERCLHKVKKVEDVALSLTRNRLRDRAHPNCMIRDTEEMMTTSLAVIDPEALSMKIYLVPQKVDFCGIENRLPKGYNHQIEIEFFEFQKWDTDKPVLRQLDNKDLGTLKIFAYGSLMLDPVMPDSLLKAQKVVLKGHKRAFNRYSRARDHLVVGTEPEGKMEGMLLEYPMDVARKVLKRIDRREGFKLDRDSDINSYTRVPVYVERNGTEVRAITYITNPEGPGYKKGLLVPSQAKRLDKGKGYRYLEDIMEALGKNKIRDPYLSELFKQVGARRTVRSASRVARRHYNDLIVRVASRYVEE